MIAPAFELSGVSVRAARGSGVQAIDDLSFACRASVGVRLIGHSTDQCRAVFDLLAGVLEPTRGVYRLGGQALAGLTAESRRALLAADLGRSLRGEVLSDERTVLQHITAVMAATGADAAFAQERAMAELQSLGLAPWACRHPAELTPGQRRLVGIARALVTRPRLVLCEAPEEDLIPEQAAAARLRLWNAIQVDSACVVLSTASVVFASLADTTLALARPD